MNYAFTGPSHHLTQEMKEAIRAAILGLPEGSVVGSGCAYGVDTLAAKTAFYWNEAVHAFPPSDLAEWNRDVPEFAVHIHPATPGEPAGAPTYRMRNQRMVDWCDELIAFTWSHDFYRSGEWMTINMARRAGKSVSMNVFKRERVLT